jgi:hypothetical protein
MLTHRRHTPFSLAQGLLHVSDIVQLLPFVYSLTPDAPQQENANGRDLVYDLYPFLCTRWPYMHGCVSYMHPSSAHVISH